VKLAAAREERAAVAEEIERLEAEFAEVGAILEAERAEQQRRASEIAGHHALLARLREPGYRNRLTIEEAARQWCAARARLTLLGEKDVGDLTISLVETYEPIAALALRTMQMANEMLSRDRASEEEVERFHRRRQLTEKLWSDYQRDAEDIASLVVDEGLELDEAVRRLTVADEDEAEEEIEDDVLA
jgi:hypothetical protein